MKKRFKGVVATVLLVGVFIMSSGAAKASAASSTYSGYVSKLNDYKSSAVVKKEKDTVAKNKVKSKDSGTYAGWIEDDSGNNLTEKVSFSKTGTYSMTYLNYIGSSDSIAPDYKGKNTHLALSTVLTNFSSANISGYWSPDNYSY